LLSNNSICTVGLRGCRPTIRDHFASTLRANRPAIGIAREGKLVRDQRAIIPRSDEISGLVITGLILAGGRGTRMEHADKGLQALAGIPLVQHVFNRLQPQVNQVIINANRNLDLYRRFGVPVCPDNMPDFAGPLAGLQCGLSHCATPLLVSVPCDSPFVPLDLVARLHAALTGAGAELAVAVTGGGEGRRTHPVFCLLKTVLLPDLTAYLQGGGRKVSAWQETRKLVEVHFKDEAAFRNINSRDDLSKFEAAPT